MRRYTYEEIETCLRNRMVWHEKAWKMAAKEIPYENGFDYPPGPPASWCGAIEELKNALDMLAAK